MKKDLHGFVKTGVVSLVLMVAFPLAYRVWVLNAPPSARSAGQFLDDKLLEQECKMLFRPSDSWSDVQRVNEPEIYRWLVRNKGADFPWVDEAKARERDPDQFADGWFRILQEMGLAIDAARKGVERQISDANRVLADEQRRHDFVKAEVAELARQVEGKPYPVAAEIGEMVEKTLPLGLVARNVVRRAVTFQTESDYAEQVRDMKRAERMSASQARMARKDLVELAQESGEVDRLMEENARARRACQDAVFDATRLAELSSLAGRHVVQTLKSRVVSKYADAK